MRKLEFKSLPLQLTDMSHEHRTAVIAHAAYDNIDRLGDVSRKGMFNMSWKNNKGDIGFYLDHKASQQPGVTQDFWENDQNAYTKVQFAKTSLGNDVMEMMDMGIIKGASFGFAPVVARKIQYKGKEVRELKEVYHGETSVIQTLTPINPRAGVVSVTKAEEDWVIELKGHLELMEKFCRNAKASDECIIKIAAEVKAMQQLVSQYDDTADTLDGGPDASANEEENEPENNVLVKLKLIHAGM